jgi:hypothetical protein
MISRKAAHAPPAAPLDPAVISLIDALARGQAAEDHDREQREAADHANAKRA